MAEPKKFFLCIKSETKERHRERGRWTIIGDLVLVLGSVFTQKCWNSERIEEDAGTFSRTSKKDFFSTSSSQNDV